MLPLAKGPRQATALQDQAQTRLDQARTASEDERRRAKEKVKIYGQADARLNRAPRDAGWMVAEAERRAKEVAGEAYDALREDLSAATVALLSLKPRRTNEPSLPFRSICANSRVPIFPLSSSRGITRNRLNY
jgi:hypothetical protein